MVRANRRELLAAGGVLVATGLAGCASNGGDDGGGGGGDGGGDDGDDETTTETEAETTAAEETTADEETTSVDETTAADDGPKKVTVGPGGGFSFSPAEFTIETGSTVEWVWSSAGHNIVVDSQPEDASWEGTEGSGTFDAGHTHTHTFEVAGTYEYYCGPHRGAGMVGKVVVE